MPCLFFENLPLGEVFSPSAEAVRRLFERVAEAAGVSVDEVEVHLTNTSYVMLGPDGSRDYSRKVHVFVEWHEGRTVEQKRRVGDAIYDFLAAHGLEKGFDITFRDSPPGVSFYYDRGMVG